MTKEEFERLKHEQKESGKSLKTFLADRGVCFTSHYYGKKKFDHPKPKGGLIPIEIHNEGSGRSVITSNQPWEINGVQGIEGAQSDQKPHSQI